VAYETKVILMLLAQQVAKSKTIKEAYGAIARAANVEGVNLPPFEEFLAEIEKDN
jgi:hypothetical protein